MKNRYHVACDLGSRSIKVAVGCYDAARNIIRVTDVAHADSAGIEKGVLVNAEAAAAVVKDLIYQMGLSKGDMDRISFNLSGTGMESKNLTGEITFTSPTVVTYGVLDRLDKIIADSSPVFGKSVMFVSNKKYFADGEFVFNPLGEQCTRFQGENFLVYSDNRQKEALSALVDLLGLKTIDIFPEGLLAAETCVKQGERDLGVALADVGFDKTDIAVFADGNIQQCCVLPVGIHDIINTISYVYKITYTDAEYVFENYSNLLMKDSAERRLLETDENGVQHWLDIGEYNRFLEDICRQILERVISVTEKHGYGDLVFSGYVISGGLAKIRGLAGALSGSVPNGFKVKTGKSYGFSGFDYVLEDPQWFTVLGALKIMASDDAEESTSQMTLSKKIIGFFSRLFPKKENILKEK
ncbi:MAG: hypothetical protein IJT95_02545 [Abditibacteriota bacterium]|nr:hypothetical protein [Abditibacteriota bacterium]